MEQEVLEFKVIKIDKVLVVRWYNTADGKFWDVAAGSTTRALTNGLKGWLDARLLAGKTSATLTVMTQEGLYLKQPALIPPEPQPVE